jgi:hypothetical protein
MPKPSKLNAMRRENLAAAQAEIKHCQNGPGVMQKNLLDWFERAVACSMAGPHSPDSDHECKEGIT